MAKRILLGLVLVLVVLALAVSVWYSQFLNRFQVDGELVFNALEAPVEVYRDEYGIPYIFADSYADLIRAQGYVAAQDRILPAELYRRLVSGRLAEVLGEAALDSDIRARVSSYYRAAERHVPLLSESSRNFLQWYVDGTNAFIRNGQDLPLELQLMGLLPLEPWTLTDALAIYYFGGSIHGTNLREELLSQAILDELGEDALAALRPVNINPDRTREPQKTGWETGGAGELAFSGLADYVEGVAPLFGSNNWAVAPTKSSSGRAILTSDPHLDSRQLPGFMLPVGLFSPGINAIGITLAGMPGMIVGRTDHVAFGATNAYGDSQDTYLEAADPEDADRYLEGTASKAFALHTETIQVKEEGELRDHTLTIRSTPRGPVISDHAVFGIRGEQLVSARWATAEQQNAEIGVDRFLTASNADEFEQAIYDIDLVFFNFVFADSEGNIGQRASGLIPTRITGGAAPLPATTVDNWNGFIPKEEMPGNRNPSRQWLGTANNDTRGDAYPYYYASQFAPHYRYTRMSEVLDGKDKISPNQSWELTLDTHNTLARKLAPEFARWLEQDSETRQLAELLASWDYSDDSDSVGATVFHVVYEAMAVLTFEDEMSPELHKQFMRSRYFWQQRLDDALLAGSPGWFDDTRTPEIEGAADIVRLAGHKALVQLRETLGPDSQSWRWGDASRLVFVSPLRKQGPGRDLLGGGEYEGRGSHETLNRGGYRVDKFPYSIAFIASARFVADFADDEKVMAVIPAGNVARQGHPWMTSQLESYVAGHWIPWWRSREKVLEHAEHRLVLQPNR